MLANKEAGQVVGGLSSLFLSLGGKGQGLGSRQNDVPILQAALPVHVGDHLTSLPPSFLYARGGLHHSTFQRCAEKTNLANAWKVLRVHSRSRVLNYFDHLLMPFIDVNYCHRDQLLDGDN